MMRVSTTKLDENGDIIFTGDILKIEMTLHNLRRRTIDSVTVFKGLVVWSAEHSGFGIIPYSPEGYVGFMSLYFGAYANDERGVQTTFRVIGNAIDTPNYKQIL